MKFVYKMTIGNQIEYVAADNKDEAILETSFHKEEKLPQNKIRQNTKRLTLKEALSLKIYDKSRSFEDPANIPKDNAHNYTETGDYILGTAHCICKAEKKTTIIATAEIEVT